MTGKIAQAVNDHVLDHLVNGPVAHRALMDAALAGDAEIEALTRRNAELAAALGTLQSGYCDAYCIKPRDGEDFVHADECDAARVLTPTESEAK